MISIRLGATAGSAETETGPMVYPVYSTEGGLLPVGPPDSPAAAEVAAFLAETSHSGKPGHVEILPRPLRQPSKIYLVGVGSGDESGWRAAGAAIARKAGREDAVSVHVPADIADESLRGLAEGAWLGEYRYRLSGGKPEDERRLSTLTVLAVSHPARQAALDSARIVSTYTNLARDLTNTPSLTKKPAWFVDQIRQHAGTNLELTVWEPAQLAEEGFGGILAVGGGSAHGPRLLQVGFHPEGATEHVVLIGKGITFDTGGIDIKPIEPMQLMRKDMGGAATVMAAALAAAELHLPLRVTVLAPLAENMVSGSAWRSGDVVRHYGGLTSEVRSTDAEGRVVLADAIAYAVAHLEPDVLLDFATLTGASRVALGKSTAALFSDNDELVASLRAAAVQAGESLWRLPLAEEYMKDVAAEIADLNNAAGSPGAITAALYLREFTGVCRDRWAHIDMSGPSWSQVEDAELPKGATGWGVRTIVRWLAARAEAGASC